MKNFYQILGVPENVEDADLKKAYKKLAIKYHPDKQHGNEEKFKEISEAYDVLKDKKKRQQYDLERQFGNQRGGFGQNFGSFEEVVLNMDGINDIFQQHFGGGTSPFSNRIRNKDIKITMNVTLEDIYFNKSKDIVVRMPSGSTKSLNVSIPVNADYDTIIRYRGLGDNRYSNMNPGDLLIALNIVPHPEFQKEGSNLFKTVDVNVFDVMIGTSYTIQHLDDVKSTLKIPSMTAPGTKLRLRGKGMPKKNGTFGDMIVTIDYDMPKKLTDVQKKMLEDVKNLC